MRLSIASLSDITSAPCLRCSSPFILPVNRSVAPPFLSVLTTTNAGPPSFESLQLKSAFGELPIVYDFSVPG